MRTREVQETGGERDLNWKDEGGQGNRSDSSRSHDDTGDRGPWGETHTERWVVYREPFTSESYSERGDLMTTSGVGRGPLPRLPSSR